MLLTPQSPIPLAARSKAYICGCLVAGNGSSNPAGVMDGSLVNGVCCERPISLPKESYRMCVCVCECVSDCVCVYQWVWSGATWPSTQKTGKKKCRNEKGQNSLETKTTLKTPNLHTAQCSYNTYSVRWINYIVIKAQIYKFYFDAKCVVKTGYDK